MKSIHKILIPLFCFLFLFSCDICSLTESDNPNVVTFSDINFELVIRESLNKPNGDITKSDLLSITNLDGRNMGIISIDGIEYCKNIEFINMWDNQISDISSLVNLPKLTGLAIPRNQIQDISCLEDLINLTYLGLANNQIIDIYPLIRNKNIDDGDIINIIENPLSETSINTYIPQLVDRGVDVVY